MPFKTINGHSLFYTHHSSSIPTSYTTLSIHGLGSSSCFYQTIIPLLSSVTTCIALDTPGSGLSSLPPGDQTVQSIADTAIALLDALKIRDVVLVGHSMGGIVASYLADEFPERVKGVILLGPVAPAIGLAEVFEKRIETIKKDGIEPLANSIPKAATGSESTPLHHAFIRALILGTSAEGYMSLCNVIAKAQKPRYRNIKAPVLILAGEEDKTASLASSKEILEEYGTEDNRKELKVLKGVGHWHCVEASEEVGRAISDFIVGLE